jgi:hypothetical protein
MCLTTKQKTKIVTAITAAIFLAFLLLGISYVAFPNEVVQGHHAHGFDNQIGVGEIFWAIFGLGLAAFVAVVAVGLLLVIRRLNRRTATIELLNSS